MAITDIKLRCSYYFFLSTTLGNLWIWEVSGREKYSVWVLVCLFMCFHPSPCNEQIEISNLYVLWSYQNTEIINFKVFTSFLFLLFLRSFCALDHLTPSFLGLYHSSQISLTSLLWHFTSTFFPLNQLQGSQIMASGHSFIFYTSVSSPIK